MCANTGKKYYLIDHCPQCGTSKNAEEISKEQFEEFAYVNMVLGNIIETFHICDSCWYSNMPVPAYAEA